MTVDHAAPRRQLRNELRQRRRALPAAHRIAAAERLADNLFALPFAPSEGYVAGYWATDGEIGLHAWQLKLPPGCVYCLPVLAADRLQFAPWRPGDPLITNTYGIPEPEVGPGSLLDVRQMALVVAPLVGFDVRGARLGMGGGWYDRSLAFRQKRPGPPPWLVGAAFSVQQVESLDTADWDVGLDAVCTESTTHDFRNLSAR